MTRTVELLGPAGVGKSTLVANLARLGRGGRPPAAIPAATYLRHMMTNLAAHGPTMARTRSLPSWPELRSIVYLDAWLDELADVAEQGERADEVVIYDHGPLYRVATLGWFGGPLCRAEWRGRRGERATQRWANALDLVVVLDAPDDVLIERIEQREQDHQIKGRPTAEACAFLGRYRAAFDELLARCGHETGPSIVRLDARTPPDQLARTVAAAISKAPIVSVR